MKYFNTKFEFYLLIINVLYLMRIIFHIVMKKNNYDL
ncbi:hypothetical protein SAMN05421856_101770 [Chryseobacterium taichungense]|uniref:Uncharacterized protein n=1 Tax=Chryseobacterium taichungense TaxID=295069 RepID=A0A1H7WI82_9FLAO|nr:hypothetical protein SAMN05421856_101770 [Chryseobacterium taichungense]